MERLVGIPFLARGRSLAGLDCWGLVCMAYQIEAGVALPSYAEAYQDTGEVLANSQLVAGHLGDWQEILDPGRLDVVLMRVGRYPCHVGIVTRPGKMLHTYSGAAARLEDYRAGIFKERIVGFYRNLQLA